MVPKIQQLFNRANRIVFLTGAGVSTASGIPDYRSKNGLYHGSKKQKHYAKWLLSHDGLINQSRTFYRFVKRELYHPHARPNVIHRVQAKLTRMNKANIITQNIDNLYEQAGANLQRLIHFHGDLYHCHCIKCGHSIDWRQYLKSPIHQRDNGLIRPNVVLYGESLNQRNFSRSLHIMLNADLIVIVGTTMKVEPFADLIKYHQPQVPIIVINQQPLHFSYNLNYIMLKMDAVDFFKKIII